jgi:hypothetical protein
LSVPVKNENGGCDGGHFVGPHYGKELACGLPDQALSDPQVVAAYIGRR